MLDRIPRLLELLKPRSDDEMPTVTSRVSNFDLLIESTCNAQTVRRQRQKNPTLATNY